MADPTSMKSQPVALNKEIHALREGFHQLQGASPTDPHQGALPPGPGQGALHLDPEISLPPLTIYTGAASVYQH